MSFIITIKITDNREPLAGHLRTAVQNTADYAAHVIRETLEEDFAVTVSDAVVSADPNPEGDQS
jgi:hypothetical protein